MFTSVDGDEDFPAAGFLLRLLRHFKFSTSTWPTINWYLSEPAVMVYSSLPSTHASTRNSRPPARARMHAFYFREQGSGKKRQKVVSKRLLWLWKRFLVGVMSWGWILRVRETAGWDHASIPFTRGGTPLYGLYRYVRPQRVWFFSRFGHKLGIDFSHFGHK